MAIDQHRGPRPAPSVLRRDRGHRRNLLWHAALAHRLSGLLLALFLPLHFLALGLAIEGEATFDGFLRWTDHPLVKVAEGGVVFLLALHFLGGMRLLVVETFGLAPWQKRAVMAVIALATVTVAAFYLRLL